MNTEVPRIGLCGIALESNSFSPVTTEADFRSAIHIEGAALLAEVAKITARYPAGPPRPPHWSGFLMRPTEIEFWMNGPFRLHDRVRWTRTAPDSSEWSRARLQP